MKELRRARFASIDGLQRSDLRLAGEVWLDDVCRAQWTTRDAMKLAAHLVRYMANSDPSLLTLSSIEGQTQMAPEEVKAALRLMHLYICVEAYTIEKNELRVALHLSELQRLRVLEARCRLDRLRVQLGREEQSHRPSDHWVPEASAAEEPAPEQHPTDAIEPAVQEPAGKKSMREARLFLKRPNRLGSAGNAAIDG